MWVIIIQIWQHSISKAFFSTSLISCWLQVNNFCNVLVQSFDEFAFTYIKSLNIFSVKQTAICYLFQWQLTFRNNLWIANAKLYHYAYLAMHNKEKYMKVMKVKMQLDFLFQGQVYATIKSKFMFWRSVENTFCELFYIQFFYNLCFYNQ